MDELFIFDKNKPQYSISQLVCGGLVILLISQILTISICKLLNLNMENDISIQSDKTVKKWQESGISKFQIISSELLGSVLYTSLAEEFVYKFLIMKKIFIETLNVDIFISCFLQALLFSATHYVNILTIKQDYKYTVLQIISTFVSGIVGGFSYIYFNSLIPCIIAHMLNNGFVLLDDINNIKN